MKSLPMLLETASAIQATGSTAGSTIALDSAEEHVRDVKRPSATPNLAAAKTATLPATTFAAGIDEPSSHIDEKPLENRTPNIHHSSTPTLDAKDDPSISLFSSFADAQEDDSQQPSRKKRKTPQNDVDAPPTPKKVPSKRFRSRAFGGDNRLGPTGSRLRKLGGENSRKPKAIVCQSGPTDLSRHTFDFELEV